LRIFTRKESKRKKREWQLCGADRRIRRNTGSRIEGKTPCAVRRTARRGRPRHMA